MSWLHGLSGWMTNWEGRWLTDSGYIWGMGRGPVRNLVRATRGTLLLRRVATMVDVDTHRRQVEISRDSPACGAYSSCSSSAPGLRQSDDNSRCHLQCPGAALTCTVVSKRYQTFTFRVSQAMTNSIASCRLLEQKGCGWHTGTKFLVLGAFQIEACSCSRWQSCRI